MFELSANERQIGVFRDLPHMLLCLLKIKNFGRDDIMEGCGGDFQDYLIEWPRNGDRNDGVSQQRGSQRNAMPSYHMGDCL